MGTLPSTHPFPSTVQFHGRWDLENNNRHAAWCGSSLHFRTASRSISLGLGALTKSRENNHNVLWHFGLKSETRTACVNGKRTLVLVPPGGDDEALQSMTVMLCDWGATLQVLNIKTLDGRPILAPVAASLPRSLLFIGASLVSGFSPPLGGIVLPHGSFQAWASVVVRTLRTRGVDAHLEMVAYPGLRLMSTERVKGMEDIFWEGKNGLGGWSDRSKETPEDIFICIGTNDQGWGEDKTTFLEHYKAFLIRLRDSYLGTCKGIYVISPFGVFRDVTPMTCRTVFEPDVQHMVQSLAQSWADSEPEDTKLYHISTEGWIDKTFTCDGLHPTVEGHEVIATKLIGFLEAQGWE